MLKPTVWLVGGFAVGASCRLCHLGSRMHLLCFCGCSLLICLHIVVRHCLSPLESWFQFTFVMAEERLEVLEYLVCQQGTKTKFLAELNSHLAQTVHSRHVGGILNVACCDTQCKQRRYARLCQRWRHLAQVRQEGCVCVCLLCHRRLKICTYMSSLSLRVTDMHYNLLVLSTMERSLAV